MKYIVYWILVVITQTERPLTIGDQIDKFGRIPKVVTLGGTTITVSEELKAFSKEFSTRDSAISFAAEAKKQYDIRGVELDSTDDGWRIVHPNPDNPYQVVLYPDSIRWAPIDTDSPNRFKEKWKHLVGDSIIYFKGIKRIPTIKKRK